MKRTLIIAEAGVNHNGDIEIAKQLCLAAKNAGADVIKFQTWITEKIITKTVRQAEYQEENTGTNKSQYEMLKELELSYADFAEVKSYCDSVGIQFASTSDEMESLDFLIGLGIPFIKLGSGEIGNIPFLRYVGTKNLPIIMSTGMSSLSDVELSIDALVGAGAKDITLLHCTTNYPCPYEQVNLKAIDTLRVAFGFPVGYSDHTEGIEVPIAAVTMGATVIEKHFTLDKNMLGPDHRASMEPCDFKDMVKAIRNVEASIGNGLKRPTDSEKEISKVVLKRIVANGTILCGEQITDKKICVKRSDTGIPAKMWDSVIGTIAKKDYEEDEGIEL